MRAAQSRSPHTRSARIREVAVVALTVTTGATDAIGFLALGGAFASVMTGNMVLLGISATKADGELAAHAAAAVITFILGNALGARIAGTARDDDPPWPRAITRALWIEAIAFVGYAILWWASGAHPGSNLALVLLAMTAVGLGIQSTAVQRFGGGLSTTYLTSTLISVVVRLASGQPGRDVALRGWILCGLIGGAAAGTVLVEHAPMAAPVLQLAGLAVALSMAPLAHAPAPSPRAAAPTVEG